MDSEVTAMLTLAVYSAIALGLVARSILQCRDGWGVWFLYVIQRIYGGLISDGVATMAHVQSQQKEAA